MAEYKTVMKTGSVYNTNSSGNPSYSDSFEVEGVSYSFERGIDDKGKPQTQIIGGIVTITYLGLPPVVLHNWIMSGHQRRNVCIEVKDLDEIAIPEETLMLSNVACVSLRLGFDNMGDKGFITTILVMQAEDVMLYKDTLNNNWTHK